MAEIINKKSEISKDSKLINNLLLLENSEKAIFKKWLKSPWCNSKKELLTLYEIFDHYDLINSDKVISKCWLFKKLHPKKKYSDQWITNSLSQLSLQLEKFFVFQGINKDEKTYHQVLIKALKERKDIDRFIKESDNLAKKILDQPTISWKDLGILLSLNEQLYYAENTPFGRQQGLTPLDYASFFLEKFYLLGKLRFDAEHTERSKKFTQEKKTASLWELPKGVFHQASPYYAQLLYANWHSKVNKKTENGFQKFQLLFFKLEHKIPQKDKQVLFIYMLNQCSRLYQKGDTAILATILKLYKYGLKESILLNNGYITESTFANIVTTAFAEGEIDFVVDFIKNYASKLTKKVQAEVKNWANAQLFYHQAQYPAAIHLILDNKFIISSFKQRSKVLLAQCHFEMFLNGQLDHDKLIAMCTAFEQQMRQESELNENRSYALIRLAQYIKKLANWQSNPNKSFNKLDKVKFKLEQESNIQAKPWLMKKIEMLKGHQPMAL